MSEAEDSRDDVGKYPAYRRMEGAGHFYRVDGPTSFTEVQALGGRYIAHQVRSAAYPERLRVMQMMACEPPYVELEADVWEDLYSRIH